MLFTKGSVARGHGGEVDRLCPGHGDIKNQPACNDQHDGHMLLFLIYDELYRPSLFSD